MRENFRIPDKLNSKRLAWRQVLGKYEDPDVRRSLWQLANTLIPYFALWCLIYLLLDVSYWLTLALSIPAAGFLIRTFIISHDCGHGSFFKSKKANDIVGLVTGLLTFTPYQHWRHEHARHHATAGDLDRRGIGDIWTLTIAEYVALPFWKRMKYRAYRSPWILFSVGALYAFVISERFPSRVAGKRERRSVHRTNLMLLGLLAVMSVTMGIKAYVLIQLPIMFFASMAGVWLFYVQHQFEGVGWERNEKWEYVAVAMEGSSFYKLPRILQWFTGSIGYHHIHHLSPRIPNYYLEKCHRQNPMLQKVKHVTLLSSLKSLTYRLWDEKRRKLVGYGGIKVFQRQQSLASRQ